MTVADISIDNGQPFIGLLEAIITEDPGAIPQQVVRFPNEDVDYVLGDPSVQAMQAVVRHVHLNRTYFISLVAWRILLEMASVVDSLNIWIANDIDIVMKYNLNEASYVTRPLKQEQTSALKTARQTGNEN